MRADSISCGTERGEENCGNVRLRRREYAGPGRIIDMYTLQRPESREAVPLRPQKAL